ncbi:MAG TPA: TetR/AcrR family transcriptional regulator [Ferruginibacter sp.]|nr:TetR/AcrR family transcriptional regulator [Ferruginibacter sp.]
MVKKRDGNFRSANSFHSFAPAMIQDTPIHDTAERILARAHDLFMQYGLRSVSMDDIASSLGMSKKTIYQYYADKDQLVDAVIGTLLAHNQTCCSAHRETAENAVHEVFKGMEFTNQVFRKMNSSVLFDMQKYHPLSFEKFLRHKNEFLYRFVLENLKRGVKEELYRPEINPELLARYRVESLLIPFQMHFKDMVHLNLAEIQREIFLLFLYGVVNQKGHKLILKYQQESIKQTDDES